MREHANRLEQLLDQHPPDQSTVILYLTDDLFLRSFTWARWPLAIPLPVEDRTSQAVMIVVPPS